MPRAAGGTADPAEAVQWRPCSERSRERDDPLVATASRGQKWFLVEVEGPWGRNAFVSSSLGRELGQKLVHRIEAAGLRPLVIRRAHVAGHFSPRDAQTSWRWAFVDSRPGSEEVRWGAVNDPAELLDVPLDGSTGIHSSRPVYAVCTHAKHDQCCAVRGRPVMQRLAATRPDDTWECSHIGGDRFAGAMVIFPEGLYFGRADEPEAEEIVRLYEEGRVDERFFRGRSSLSHAVQAAEHYARLHLGLDRIDSFASASEEIVDTPAANAAAPAVGIVRDSHPVARTPEEGQRHIALPPKVVDRPTDASTTVVTLALSPAARATVAEDGSAATVVVVVAETLSDPMLSTCAATRFGRVREYELVSLGVQRPISPPQPRPARGAPEASPAR